MKAVLTWVVLGLMAFSWGGLLIPHAASQEHDFFDLLNQSERTDGYFSMLNQADGAVLLRTARILHVGNEFIDRSNRRFRVTSIENDTAWAEEIRESSAAAGTDELNTRPVQADEGKPKVGIYHSHGAESYVPDDGTESIDQGGGILDVGDTFSEALEEQGVETVHETETHVPHDAGAYQRSRRTAEKLLIEEEADIIIDLHRDAVPPEEYAEVVEGEPVTQLLLVVGAQNQNAESNMQLAQDLKGIADERHPGLVKGILSAPGSYNQDLDSSSILVEVGAHENDKGDAERAVVLFADVVNEYLTGEAAPQQTERTSRIAGSSVLMVLVALAAALFVYLLIAAGSWAELKRKTVSFFRREFADLRQR
ncbi:MAG: stage II sporulation protein P, partial [Bacillota bacterium]